MRSVRQRANQGEVGWKRQKKKTKRKATEKMCKILWGKNRANVPEEMIQREAKIFDRFIFCTSQ